MRRIVLLLALAIPLASVTMELTPSAAACTPPVCRIANCDVTFDPPKVDPEGPSFDPGLVGADCEFDDV